MKSIIQISAVEAANETLSMLRSGAGVTVILPNTNTRVRLNPSDTENGGETFNQLFRMVESEETNVVLLEH